MNKIKSFLVRHKEKFSYGANILAFVLGVFFWKYPMENTPELSITYKDYDLVSVSEPSENLQILFNGKDIKKENLNLKIYSFVLKNTGKNDITPVSYDTLSPLRIRVSNSSIVNCNTIHSAEGDKELCWLSQDSSTVFLKHTLLKPTEKEEFKIAVLHKTGITPTINIEGRIADTDILINQEEGNTIGDWLYVVFVLAVMFAGIFALGLAIELLIWFIKYLVKEARKRSIGHVYDVHYESSKVQRTLVKIYALLGRKLFIATVGQLQDTKLASDLYRNEVSIIQTIESFKKLRTEKKVSIGSKSDKVQYDSTLITVLETLKDAELATVNEDFSISLNTEVSKEIQFILLKLNKTTNGAIGTDN